MKFPNFPSVQFHIYEYEVEEKETKTEVVKCICKALIFKRLKKLGAKSSEVICTEFTISSR